VRGGSVFLFPNVDAAGTANPLGFVDGVEPGIELGVAPPLDPDEEHLIFSRPRKSTLNAYLLTKASVRDGFHPPRGMRRFAPDIQHGADLATQAWDAFDQGMHGLRGDHEDFQIFQGGD